MATHVLDGVAQDRETSTSSHPSVVSGGQTAATGTGPVAAAAVAATAGSRAVETPLP